MKAVFQNSAELERSVKEHYHFPPYIMMENAAASMEIVLNSVMLDCEKQNPKVLIACGSGNNGADGVALARRIHSKYEVAVFLACGPIKTDEGKIQYEMAKNVGVNFLDLDEFISLLSEDSDEEKVIIDCIFGTGFHGELSEPISDLINSMNDANGIKIACDIPSALTFHADITVTMGCLKTSLFSDKAKAVCGQILVADLGLQAQNFERLSVPDACLIEECDMLLPFRTKKDTHKGNFGHTAVIAGEKSGAAILASEAALKSGSGLVTLVPLSQNNTSSDINQFKIDASVMMGNSLPKNTTTILLGSGLGRNEQAYSDAEKILEQYLALLQQDKHPAVVLDADMMYYPQITKLLDKLNAIEGARIVLTPHLKELSSLASLCNFGNYSVTDLSSIEVRLSLGKKFADRFPKTAIIMKSANSLICLPNGEFFICADGNPSLSKAGSGDVLAGTIASMLAQGYDLKAATITATELHALASVYCGDDCSDKKNRLQGDEFFLTAENYIDNIGFIARRFPQSRQQ